MNAGPQNACCPFCTGGIMIANERADHDFHAMEKLIQLVLVP